MKIIIYLNKIFFAIVGNTLIKPKAQEPIAIGFFPVSVYYCPDECKIMETLSNIVRRRHRSQANQMEIYSKKINKK
jgi:hypothetical protein